MAKAKIGIVGYGTIGELVSRSTVWPAEYGSPMPDPMRPYEGVPTEWVFAVEINPPPDTKRCFIVRVTDDPDTLCIEVRDEDRNPIPAVSMPRDGEGEPMAPVRLAFGEVVVPNGNGGGPGNH